MQILKGPRKGQTTHIEISETQTNRVLIGLSWDMKELEKLRLPEVKWIPFKKRRTPIANYIEDCVHAYRTMRYEKRPVNEHDDPHGRDEEFKGFDLDLYCYIFDADGALLETIGPDYTELLEDSGTVYHSGDDFTGTGALDDEVIYIATKNVPKDYAHFVFCVKSDCAFSLDEITNPVIRIADSKSDEDFVKILIEPPANINASGFIFAHIYNDGGQWIAKTIGEYCDFDHDVEAFFKEMLNG